jgi:hypothetical protein
MTGTVSDWLAKAHDDLRTVELLEAFDDYPCVVAAFHCQQVVLRLASCILLHASCFLRLASSASVFSCPSLVIGNRYTSKMPAARTTAGTGPIIHRIALSALSG